MSSYTYEKMCSSLRAVLLIQENDWKHRRERIAFAPGSCECIALGFMLYFLSFYVFNSVVFTIGYCGFL